MVLAYPVPQPLEPVLVMQGESATNQGSSVTDPPIEDHQQPLPNLIDSGHPTLKTDVRRACLAFCDADWTWLTSHAFEYTPVESASA